ncbi:MAG: 3-hydroxyacyl-[acyl-carrier-protein] dehydratase FabZ [Nitrospirae bacterium GWC2_42_7]|nr:MAG: 3-hydroxyacyl-[acyl-carrier-protein] dehydratase FabZ [Nitrospirae bacterium GWC2_42_7]
MMNINEIMKYLPHRYPFLLVDRIVDLQPGVSITGIKNVTMNEPFFQGHFPGQPIMPGVLIVEAMAQVAGVMAFSSGVEGKSVFFMSIEKAKFRRPVVPGDQIKIEIRLLQQRGNVWKFAGSALVEGKTASEAEFTAMVTNKEI